MAEIRKKREISFSKKDLDVNEYLKEQGNASRYIIQLIREDMKKKNTQGLGEDADLNEKVNVILDEVLKIKTMLNQRTISLNIVPNQIEDVDDEVLLGKLNNLVADEDDED